VEVLGKRKLKKSSAPTRIRTLDHLAGNKASILTMLPPPAPPNRYNIKKKKVNFTLEQAFKVQRGVQVYIFSNFVSLKLHQGYVEIHSLDHMGGSNRCAGDIM
jgi:ArsR family metal-binding transcriptional regulator